MKYYLYRSDTKIRMLHSQIEAASTKKTTLEWKLSAGVGMLSRKAEWNPDLSAHKMMSAVIEELERAGQVGTIYEPNLYIKGVMPMRWGLYNDSGLREPDEGPLVYFGGLDADEGVLLGLGGSSKHVLGHDGATGTWSRSHTPALVNALLNGIKTGHSRVSHLNDDESVFRAMVVAQMYLRPPTQHLEFFARTLQQGRVDRCVNYIGVSEVNAILGTPLYVALTAPNPDESHFGIIPD